MVSVGVVCHDAGGAQIVSNWVAANVSAYDFHLVVAGPAVKVFRDNLGWETALCLNEIVEKCDWLLCGTSWQSRLETEAIRCFKKHGKMTVAFLDHWTNYDERFILESSKILPDKIWVVDDYALKIAKTTFDNIPISKEENFYFKKIKHQIFELGIGREIKNSILYICEPIREHALLKYGDERHWGYTEEDALEYFLDNIDCISKNVKNIVIRPHPSEKYSKYDWALKETELNLKIGGHESLVDEISRCSTVVGCDSMAMVVGLLADKSVVSSIPPGGRACSLPYDSIQSLQGLVGGREPNGE